MTKLLAPSSHVISNAELEQALFLKLTEQLENQAVAEFTAKFIMDELLTWKGVELPLNQADSILAFSFGNRILANGNQIPGPMNQDLADTVVDIYNKTGKTVYAQWEIAEEIADRIPSNNLLSINPTINRDGSVTYLSTAGVAQQALNLSGGDMGKVIVVSFYEHSLRTINTAKDFGIEAYAPEGVNLPHHYDEQSGQAWTRDQKTFVMHELVNRATNQRTKLIEKDLSAT